MKEKIESITSNVSWISVFCLSMMISNCLQCERLGDINKELKDVNERLGRIK